MVDYVVIRNYTAASYPILEDFTYSPYTISTSTGDEDIVVDSAISSNQVIGEIPNNAAVVADTAVSW